MSYPELPDRPGTQAATAGPAAVQPGRALVRLGGGLRRISGPPTQTRPSVSAGVRSASYLSLGQKPGSGASAEINQGLRGLIGSFAGLTTGPGAGLPVVQEALRAARHAIARVQTGITPISQATSTIVPAMENFVRVLSQQPGGLSGVEGALDECAGHLNALITAIQTRLEEISPEAET